MLEMTGVNRRPQVPCPFCGCGNRLKGGPEKAAEPIFCWKIGEIDGRVFVYAVRCSRCQAEGPPATNADQAVDFWDRRSAQ